MAGVYADSEQAEVLAALVKLLIDKIPALSTKSCFLTVLPVPPHLPSDNLMVTVSPNGGTFPEEFTAGGGEFQCTEDTSAIITILSRFQANRPGHEQALLSDQARGMLRMKKLILKAVTGKNLTSTVDANLVLRNLMAPRQSSTPEYVGDEQLAQIGITVSLMYDWALTQ